MNIVFMTQNDPIYVIKFFQRFFSIYRDFSEIKAVVISKAMGKSSSFTLARQMFSLYGILGFLRMTFRYTGIKALDVSSNVLPLKIDYSIASLCKKHNIQVIYENEINSPVFIKRLRNMDIDLFISIASPYLFRGELIRIAKLGCINIHNAPLPKYRGMLPSFWQLYSKEKFGGITIHEVNEKFDEGKIISRKMIAIAEGESLDSLVKKTKVIGADMLKEVIEMFKNGDIAYQENRPEDGSYFSFPTRRDARTFKKMGGKLF